jgi:hypothetical protein
MQMPSFSFSGFAPRPTQVLSLLLRLFAKCQFPEQRGVMMQVSTGEGKTLIIAMFAVFHQMTSILIGSERQLIGNPFFRKK